MKYPDFEEKDKMYFGIEEMLSDRTITNIDEIFELSVKILDKKFGKGFSDSNPAIVIQMFNGVTNLYLLSEIESNIMMLPERFIDEMGKKITINFGLTAQKNNNE